MVIKIKFELMSQSILNMVPLFASLPANEITYLAETLKLFDAPAQTILFNEAEPGDSFYIVIEGELEIIKSLGTADELLIGIRKQGEYVGEMSLFNLDGLRTATTRTRTQSKLFEMTRMDFDSLLNRQPKLAYSMVRVLSNRLSEAHNNNMHEMHEKNLRLTNAYESLQSAQKQIIIKERLERELQMAHDVQVSLIPSQTPQLNGFDFAVLWKPARGVSGDFYDFIPIPRPERDQSDCGIVIADVAGKGMPAAIFMSVTRGIVRASVTGMPTPSEAMQLANRLIYDDSAQKIFVTLFYAQLNPQSGDVTYVNAGHNPTFHYQAAEQQWAELTRTTSTPLGLSSSQTIEQKTCRLSQGDILFFYTDGLTDVKNKNKELFGKDRLLQILEDYHEHSAAGIAALLENEIAFFSEKEPFADDVTFVIVKRNSQ